MQGAILWAAEHQCRTLRPRYAAPGFVTWSQLGVKLFRGKLSPLGQATLEPAHYRGRPDIAALLTEEVEVEEEEKEKQKQ